MIVQSVWLLPEPAQHTAQIVAGIEPAPSIAHAAYATLELLKLVLLFSLGIATVTTGQEAREQP